MLRSHSRREVGPSDIQCLFSSERPLIERKHLLYFLWLPFSHLKNGSTYNSHFRGCLWDLNDIIQFMHIKWWAHAWHDKCNLKWLIISPWHTINDKLNKFLAWHHADCTLWNILSTFHSHPVTIVIILMFRKKSLRLWKAKSLALSHIPSQASGRASFGFWGPGCSLSAHMLEG